MVEIARQMEKASHLSKDLSQAEKNGIAFKLMADQLTQMKRQLEVSKPCLSAKNFKETKNNEVPST